jgi:hypothetical protein
MQKHHEKSVLQQVNAMNDEELILAFWSAKILKTPSARKNLLKSAKSYHSLIDFDDLELIFKP